MVADNHMEIDMTDLITAFAAVRPELADRYARQVRGSFEVMVAQHGSDLRGIQNSWTLAKTYRKLVAPVLAPRHRIGDVCAIDDAKLTKAANEYADAALAQWQAKIEEKMGDLEAVVVGHFGGCRYRISGNRAGKRVSIEQDMIINVSAQGTLFNQFPAHIYVDGRFTSAANYKKMFA